MNSKLLPSPWATLLAIMLTLTALSCADYPDGAQDPDRAIQPDMTFLAAEDEILTVAPDAGVLAKIEAADPATWSVTSTGTLATTGPLDCEDCPKGSVDMDADGGFSYTPAADFEGNDYLYITVASDTGGEGEYIVLFDVAGSNDPPGAADDEVATDEDTVVTISPLENDVDIDLNDSLVIMSVGDPGHGSVAADLETGSITYTPAANFFGEDGFTYVIADLAGEEASARVTITVAPVNDAPTAAEDSYGTDEDEPLTVDVASGVLSNDDDVDDAAADLAATAGTLASAQGGSVEMQADGAFTYTPAGNFFGDDSFTYEVIDPAGASAQGTVTLTVTEVNDAPRAEGDSYAGQEDTGLTIPADQGLLINDSDVDNDALSVVSGTVATTRGGSATLAADGGFSYEPARNFFGADSFEYTVTDGRGGLTPATVTVNVAGVEDPPVAVNDSVNVDEGGQVNIDVLANDSDPDLTGTEGLTIVRRTNGDNGTVVINNGRSVTYTPSSDFVGTDSFTYTISDGDQEATATVTVTVVNVNDPPTAVDDSAETSEESPVLINVTANDTDPDQGELLTVQSVNTSGANGTVTISPNNRSVTYTPNNDFVGSAAFTYVVEDREGATDTGTVTVTVRNVAPVANNDSLGLIGLGSTVSINVLDNDEDGEILVKISNDGPGTRVNQIQYGGATYDIPADLAELRQINVTCGAMTVSANGGMALNRTGLFGCPASDNLTYTIVDTEGVASASAATVSWSFNSSDIITLAAPPGNQTDEDEPLSVNSADGVLADTDSLWRVSTTNAVETLFGGSATVGIDGDFSYTPPPHFSGTDSFGFTATAPDEDPDASGRALVIVTPVDDAPLALADIYALGGGSLAVPASQGLLHNDLDLEGDDLTVTAVDDSALSGALEVQPDGAFTYTGAPTANETFTYTVSDGNSTSSASVTLVNGASVPSAAAADYATSEDAALSENLPTGGATASAVTASRFGGTVSMDAGGGFTYTPPPNFSGTDSFVYRLDDGSATANGLVRVTVNARPDAPLAGDDFYTVGRDTPFSTAAAGGVLANDIDPDGDALTITTTSVQTTDQGGEVEIAADGSFVYAPPTGITGTDRFDYTMEDGSGNGDAATVIVTITP
jgi:large repetitive protein